MTEEVNNEQPEVNVDATVETPVVDTPTAEVVAETAEVVTEVETVEETKVSQEAFNKLYFEKMQAQRELEALQNQSPTAPTTTTPPAVNTDLAPTLEQFDYDEEAHTAALIDYKVDQKLNAAMSKQTETAQQNAAVTQREQEQLAFNDKAVAFAATNPNYEAAITASNGATYPQAVGEVLLHSDVGPELDYELLTNPAKMQELATMSPVQAIMEMGRMEDAIKANKSKAPEVSQAPAPIEDQVGGGGRVVPDYVNENTSMEDYYKASQAAKAAKLQSK